MSNFLTSQQVAHRVGLKPKTISAYKVRGKMPAPDLQFGRTPLWRPETIDEWRSTVRSRVTE